LKSKPGSTAAFNVDVRPGDTIMVSHAGIVYVVGDVGKPGGFLIENNDRLTVLEALALAQGTNRTASLNHAKLIRKTELACGRKYRSRSRKSWPNKAEDELLADGDILIRANERCQGCATRRREHLASRCRRRHLSSPVVRHWRHCFRAADSATTWLLTCWP
jgi:protein involved in polysaccharide export with SLBB domain